MKKQLFNYKDYIFVKLYLKFMECSLLKKSKKIKNYVSTNILDISPF
jgi:hypothetical protein